MCTIGGFFSRTERDLGTTYSGGLHIARAISTAQSAPDAKGRTRGYFVSTVGRDEKTIREYIQNQEKEDQRLEQLISGSDGGLQAAHVCGAALRHLWPLT